MIRLACVTGRFQPVHAQHVELFEIALQRADHLVVAVTNPDTGARHEETTSEHRHRPEANPFTYFERTRMLTAALADRGLAARATIVPFDMTRPETWCEYVPLTAHHFVRAYSPWERDKASRIADAGYPVTVLDGDPATKLSATDIRAHLHHDNAEGKGAEGDWADLVPPAVAPVLRELLAQRRPAELGSSS